MNSIWHLPQQESEHEKKPACSYFCFVVFFVWFGNKSYMCKGCKANEVRTSGSSFSELSALRGVARAVSRLSWLQS